MAEESNSQFSSICSNLAKHYSKTDYLTSRTVMIGVFSGLVISLWSLLFGEWKLALAASVAVVCLNLLLQLSSSTPATRGRLWVFFILLAAIYLLSLVDQFRSPIFYIGFTLLFFPHQAYPQHKKLVFLSHGLLIISFLTLYYLTLTTQEDQINNLNSAIFDSGIVACAILTAIVASSNANSKSENPSLLDRLHSTNLRYKSLLRVACHDLSNPLTLIMGSAQIAQTNAFKQDQEKTMVFWEKIERAADQLNQYIGNMRAFEAMQEPKRLVIRQVKVLALIEEVCFSLQEKLVQHAINLDVDHQAPQDTKVMIDPHYFSINCLRKIMNNAIRYSKSGGTIRLKTYLEDDSLYIVVKDDGPGIRPDILKKLFQFDFMKVEIINSGEKGLGFGLSIAKLLMMELGGDLRVESLPRPDQTRDHAVQQDSSNGKSGTSIELRLALNFTPTGKSRGLDGNPLIGS